jgi:hypothetical protein
MSSYRCYLLDVSNHVAADRFIECEADGVARAHADELLADTEYPAMEIWDGTRFIYQAMQHSALPGLN